MAKFALTLILVGAIITVQGKPEGIPPQYAELLEKAREQQWNSVQHLLREICCTDHNKDAAFDAVRNLKPVDGGHVAGEAEYFSHSSSNIDGKTTEDKEGHKVINNDGQVKEFDFTPKIKPSTFIQPSTESQIGSASDYSLQFTPPTTADYVSIGGKKNGYNNVKTGQLTNVPSIPHSFSSIPSQEGQGSHNSYNHKYSYAHSHSFVDGKPIEGALLNNGNFQLDTQKSLLSPILYTDVRDLKPVKGGQVYGESQFQFHSSSNVNGKVSEDQGGHKVINNNGQVREFDFTPSLQKSPVVNYFN